MKIRFFTIQLYSKQNTNIDKGGVYMTHELLVNVLLGILAAAIPGILLIIGLITNKINEFISAKTEALKEKTDNDLLRDYIDLTKDNALTIVQSLNQTLVDDLKATSDDGKLTEDEIKKISSDALERLKSTLSESMEHTFSKAFGDVDVFLKDIIEQAVGTAKFYKH